LNRLQLNSSKTQVIWCATNGYQHILPATALSVDGVMGLVRTSVRDLEIYIDFILCQLRQIRLHIPPTTFQTLVIALILSRLDYGNGILVDLPA